jgi:hypothetical protein
MTKIRTYSDLIKFKSFEDRFDYLKLGGEVGQSTFGFDRYLNQRFYQSHAWKSVRRHVIIRDGGCDLAVEGYEIHSGLLVHHINPMTLDDILHDEDWVTDPEFLITTSHNTHNAIHYGDKNLLMRPVLTRQPGDTKLW